MECAFEAQNLISISLRKIQSSRTQRGGIKLHKNLLVTYVLRNARQFYMSKDFVQAQSRAQQYEDVIATTREKPDYLELTGSFTELADDFYCNFGEAADDESDSWHCGGAHGGHPAEAAAAHQDASACAMAASLSGDSVSSSSNNIMLSSEASSSCWSCGDKVSNAWDLIPAPIAQQQQQQQANQKTVLDLDTHVVTTVTNGYFHSDCCAPAIKPQGAQAYCNKKRKLDSSYHIVDPEFYWPDLGPSWPSKRMRTEDESHSDSEQLDTTNISNLISVLGSGGLTEFMSWQHTDLEQIFTAQTICLRHTLLTGSAWTRAIEAF